MKNKSFIKHLVYSLIGFIICAVSAILGKYTRDTQGTMQTLSYIFIGIGAGIFGQNLGAMLNIHAAKKSPQLAKQREIEERDERNQAIKYKAKAKAYDLMVMVFGAFILALALMEVNFPLIFATIAVYIFVVFSNIYYINKYNKEM